MNTIVSKRKQKTFPWGVEIELVNDRCIYLAAKNIVTDEKSVKLIINDTNSIEIPKSSIRKILIMGTGTNDDTGNQE